MNTGVKKVSVIMVTYNHEQFIRQAIEGVLMQHCHCEVELIVANDVSPDNTDQIVKDLIANHGNGHWIKYVRHAANKGMRSNFLWALEQCNGDYIALCDGDDYWTDPNKLQAQVDFLNANEDFSAVAHQTVVDYDDNVASHNFSENPRDIFSLNDLISSQPFHTSSFVFRKRHIDSMQLPTDIISIDRALFMYLGGLGKIKLLQVVMSVYRRNAGGISNNLDVKKFKNDLKLAKWIKSLYPDFKYSDSKAFLYRTFVLYPTSYGFSYFVKNYALYVFNSLVSSPFNIKYVLKSGIIRNVVQNKRINRL